LGRAYADHVTAVLDSPLWSAADSGGLRIPWRSAVAACASPTLKEDFRSPGLYLFGSSAGVPLYLGMARAPLRKRLWGRYVRGQRSQCQLAVDYESELLAHGVDGFPPGLRAWYRRSFGNSTVRLVGAAAFAQHGIGGIWFTVLPIADVAAIRPFEQRMISVADAWNRRQGLPPLLNRQDM